MAKAVASKIARQVEDLDDVEGHAAARSQGAVSVDLEAELGPGEATRLLAAIDEADAAYSRGEDMPAEVLLEDVDRIFNEG